MPHEPDTSVRTSRSGLAVFLATGLYLGLVPFAPGTFGALLGLPLAGGLQRLESPWVQAAAIAAICLAGIPMCTAAARKLGGAKDPGSIVLDEIASLPITFFMIPMDRLWVIACGFALHRFFDITKPPPARNLERLPNGLGIMADDWIAGLYSNLALRGVIWAVTAVSAGP